MMKLESTQQHWQRMSDESRIWIYQSSAELSTSNQAAIEAGLNQFVGSWNSHGSDLLASWAIFFDCFIVIFVDEQQQAPSGCSIDKSVRLLQDFERDLGLTLFDRMTCALYDEGSIKKMPVRELWAQMKAGNLDLEETLVFDNLIKSKRELQTSWITPLAQSWHKDAFMR